jgi:ADP-ribose pyrophosphatase YjhB (NUDIX family)
VTDTTQATDPTAEPLTDPTTLRDVAGVDYQITERTDDAEHFERHEATAGFAAVAVTNADGEIALTETGQVWILPHAGAEPGEDFVDVARRAADDLLGLDVTIDRVVRARRKDCTLEDSNRETTIHDVVFEASPADDATLPDADDVQSCQADAIAWFDHVPESVPENEVCEDIAHFVGEE